jgi:hypothetical protein
MIRISMVSNGLTGVMSHDLNTGLTPSRGLLRALRLDIGGALPVQEISDLDGSNPGLAVESSPAPCEITMCSCGPTWGISAAARRTVEMGARRMMLT